MRQTTRRLDGRYIDMTHDMWLQHSCCYCTVWVRLITALRILGGGNVSSKGTCTPGKCPEDSHSQSGAEWTAANGLLVHCSLCKQCILLRTSKPEPRIHIWRSPSEGECAVWPFAVDTMATGQPTGPLKKVTVTSTVTAMVKAKARQR